VLRLSGFKGGRSVVATAKECVPAKVLMMFVGSD
jgi:hypothetical protein